MARGALQVPILVQARPVQRVSVIDIFARVEMEPTLTALGLRARIPSNGEGLVSASGEFDQILLQRGNAEDVFDDIVGELAVGAIRADGKLVAAFGER